jgi:Rnl2 family RNA ligase
MEKFPKYPHIENLSRMGEILRYKCVVTEKIHGTNFRMMYDDKDGLILGSHENIIYKAGQEVGSLYGASAWCLEQGMTEKLKQFPNHVFYGEFHGQGVQKGIKYCDGKDLRIFNILDPNGEFVPWQTCLDICHKIGLKTVIEIASGFITADFLQSIRDSLSRTAIENGISDPDNTAEGVVIQPETPRKDKHGNWIMAKYKSDKWAERASQAKTKDIDPEKLEIQKEAMEFAASVVTPGRMANIIDHITRSGNTELKMSRTGEFLRELVNDIMESEKEVYDKLDKQQKNIYNKAINQIGSGFWKKQIEG